MRTFIFIMTFFSFSIWADIKTKITSVSFEKIRNMGKMSIYFQSPIVSTPELLIKDKIIQVAIPHAAVWPKIDKRVSVKKKFDTKIMAYQYTNDLARVRAVLPYSVKGDKSKISLVEKGKSIDLLFPIPSKKTVRATRLNSMPSKVSKEKSLQKDSYDESYLEKLLSDKEISKLEESDESQDGIEDKDDVVNVRMSSPERKTNFSFLPYIFKVVFFLGIILLGLFVVVKILKKGIFNKSKLGFLSRTKVVEVLNKTYIAPKKSIITVKAHDQILLIGIDEKGMHFLTEIKNSVGLLKEGEKQLAGDNFDTNVQEATTKDKEFNLKEILDQPAKNGGKKLSETIKNKVKNLKSLQ